MKLTALLSLIIFSAVATTGCSGGSNEGAIPKPQAYPRLSLPDSVFTTLRIADVEFQLNSAATVSESERDDATWIDITYHGIEGGKLYLTLSTAPAERLPDLIENRIQRASLNVGNATTEVTELTSAGGWDGILLVTRSSLTTPVQIIAHDDRHLLSGALYLQMSPTATPDSISPIIETVKRDMLTTLQQVTTIR